MFAVWLIRADPSLRVSSFYMRNRPRVSMEDRGLYCLLKLDAGRPQPSDEGKMSNPGQEQLQSRRLRFFWGGLWMIA